MRFRWWAVLAFGLALAGCGTTASVHTTQPPARSHIAAPRIVRPSEPLQCVTYARDVSGIAIYGDANTWWSKAAGQFRRAARPQPGAVIVLRSAKGRGHLAVVRRIVGSREIVVDHANWLNEGEIDLDTPILDVSAGNDWTQVRVWYTPDDHYGTRVYGVDGFILPSRTTTASDAPGA